MFRRIVECRARGVAVALGLVSAIMPGMVRAQDPLADHRPDAFERVDLEFRSMYAGGRAATMARLGPVIVVEFDQLILIRDGKRTAVDAVPPIYHRLKSVSHAPLAIYVALAPYGDAPLDEARVMALRSFRASIATMETSLDASGFDQDQLARSRSLLRDCLAFLDDVLAKGRYSLVDLKALTRTAGPVVLANASDAARAQIDGYHAQVRAWHREIPDEEWSRLHVLVMGPQMPRKHNVAVQYFAKVMDLEGESRRLVYAEELAGEPQALNLLATHQLDSELSEAFFGDHDRMEIDLLGNAASVYLDALDVSK